MVLRPEMPGRGSRGPLAGRSSSGSAAPSIGGPDGLEGSREGRLEGPGDRPARGHGRPARGSEPVDSSPGAARTIEPGQPVRGSGRRREWASTRNGSAAGRMWPVGTARGGRQPRSASAAMLGAAQALPGAASAAVLGAAQALPRAASAAVLGAAQALPRAASAAVLGAAQALLGATAAMLGAAQALLGATSAAMLGAAHAPTARRLHLVEAQLTVAGLEGQRAPHRQQRADLGLRHVRDKAGPADDEAFQSASMEGVRPGLERPNLALQLERGTRRVEPTVLATKGTREGRPGRRLGPGVDSTCQPVGSASSSRSAAIRPRRSSSSGVVSSPAGAWIAARGSAVSGPSSMRMSVTPVSASPASTAAATGAAPRWRGRSEGCRFRAP